MEASSTEEHNYQAIGGIPKDGEKNRQADNATEIEVQREQVKEKVVKEPNIQGDSDKEKKMRARPRSPERSRDKIGRAKSMTRRGSRDKEKEYKSRSKSRERPRVKSQERVKEKTPNKEEATAKSVSIMKEANRGRTPIPQRQHVSLCRRCHTFDGTIPKYTQRNICYALTMTCIYCQKKGHIAKACYDRYNERRDDHELGSPPCFACVHPDHVWENCPRGKPDDKNPVDWQEGSKTYYRFKNRFVHRRKENIPELWKRLVRYHEQERNRKLHGHDTARDHHRPSNQSRKERTGEKAAGGQAIRNPGSSARTVRLTHNAGSSPARRVTVIKSDTPTTKQAVSVTQTSPAVPVHSKSARRERNKSFSSNGSNESDLRNRINVLHLASENPTIPPPITPSKTVQKRNREDDNKLFDETSSTYSGDSQSTVPVNDDQVKVGFIETKARNANGQLTDMKIAVFKRLRTDASGNLSPDTSQIELTMQPGYKLIQVEIDNRDEMRN